MATDLINYTCVMKLSPIVLGSLSPIVLGLESSRDGEQVEVVRMELREVKKASCCFPIPCTMHF